MYMYQERFKARLEERLSVFVNEPRMLEWFRTTFVTSMRKIAGNTRALYLGTSDGFANHNSIKWSIAPQAIRDAIMRDEQVLELRADSIKDDSIALIVRAMREVLVHNVSLKSFSAYSMSTLLTRGQKLLDQENRRLRDEAANKGMKLMWTGAAGYAVWGLFNHAALDKVGHDLLNCLRGNFESKKIFNPRITYLGLRRYGKFVSIAEVTYMEADEKYNTSETRKWWHIESHMATSNGVPDATMHSCMREACQEIYGAPLDYQLYGPRHQKVWQLVDGELTLTTYRLHDMPTTSASRFLHHTLTSGVLSNNLEHYRNYLANAGRRLGMASRVDIVFDSLMHICNDMHVAPREEWTNIPDWHFASKPEVAKSQPTLKILKHRSQQRQLQQTGRTIPRLLRSMTQRLTEDAFENTGTNMVMTPRPRRIGSADAVGILSVDSSSEGDRAAMTLVTRTRQPFTRSFTVPRSQQDAVIQPALHSGVPMGTYTYKISALDTEGNELGGVREPHREFAIQTAIAEMREHAERLSEQLITGTVTGRFSSAIPNRDSVAIFTGAPGQKAPERPGRGWTLHELPSRMEIDPRLLRGLTDGVVQATSRPARVRGMTPSIRVIDYMDLIPPRRVTPVDGITGTFERLRAEFSRQLGISQRALDVGGWGSAAARNPLTEG